MTSACTFCAVVQGALTADVIAQGKAVDVYMDPGDPRSVEILVAPRMHAATVHALDFDVYLELVRVAEALKVAVARPTGVKGSRVGLHVHPSDSTEDISHAHVRVTPIFPGQAIDAPPQYDDTFDVVGYRQYLRTALQSPAHGEP